MSKRVAAGLAELATVPVYDPRGGTGNRMASEIVNTQVDIPVGGMILDAQRSAQIAEQQLRSTCRRSTTTTARSWP